MTRIANLTYIFIENQPANVDFIASIPQAFELNYSWSIGVEAIGINGQPELRVDASINGTRWFEIVKQRIDPKIDGTLIQDNTMPFRYIRIRYFSKNATQGTISAYLFLKDVE